MCEKNAQPRLELAPFEHSRHLSVPLKSDALTIEPPKLQNAHAQTQQYKPKLRLFRTRNLFYYHNIVFYYHKCKIFDNIKNNIAILDALYILDISCLLQQQSFNTTSPSQSQKL